MSILKSVNSAKKVITDLVKESTKAKAESQEMIKKTDEKISLINSMLETAAKEFDPAAYKKAKHELEDAKLEKEMYLSRYNAFSEKPLISEEEYNKITSDIIAEYDAKQAEAKEKIFTLTEQIGMIAQELQNALNEANETLHTLQEDIFKNSDMKKLKNGSFLNTDEKYIKDNTAIAWGTNAVGYYLYTEMKKARDQE